MRRKYEVVWTFRDSAVPWQHSKKYYFMASARYFAESVQQRAIRQGLACTYRIVSL